MKTWPTKITEIELKLSQTRVFYQPEIKITERRALEEGKGARAGEKRLATVFSFSVDFRESFERQKKK